MGVVRAASKQQCRMAGHSHTAERRKAASALSALRAFFSQDPKGKAHPDYAARPRGLLTQDNKKASCGHQTF